MFRNWASDPEVCRYLAWEPYESLSETERTLEKWAACANDPKNYHWAIEYGGHAIGSISVVEMKDESLSCEIGYCVGRAYWGRGIMTEALTAVLDFLFGEVGFNRVMAKHDAQNRASGRVMQKAGMRPEGAMREAKRRRDGSFGDLLLYSMLLGEWTAQRQGRRRFT